ncbi:MAG TPA: hypothetical protein VFV93_05545 [Thermomicrobiales bacterium]|nr:hypothetical protein [Thermomicrobiales bacterium]
MQEADWISRDDRRVIDISTELEQAIVAAVAYSDIFDYPLSPAEIHRYLIEQPASREAVEAALAAPCIAEGPLSVRDGYVTLAGREASVATRQARLPDSERLWQAALGYGRVIAGLPFVRMVAITGELAMDNVQPGSDIDYFIVTQPGRVWLCRLLTIGVVRVAALRGVTICPNYLLAEHALTLHERNLYAAHELAQMVPIAGHAIYQRLRAENGWIEDYLPNAGGPPRKLGVRPWLAPLRRLAERALAGRVGDRLERWERERKIRRLSRIAGENGEASFSPDWCKGHVSGHERRILAAFDDRRRVLEEGVR